MQLSPLTDQTAPLYDPPKPRVGWDGTQIQSRLTVPKAVFKLMLTLGKFMFRLLLTTAVSL